MDDAAQLPGQVRGIIDGLDEAAGPLAAYGWITFELSPADDYVQAARLVRNGEVEAAEDLLVGTWNEAGATLLRSSVQRVQTLYRVATRDYVNLEGSDVATSVPC
jgi:hypothetical protein